MLRNLLVYSLRYVLLPRRKWDKKTNMDQNILQMQHQENSMKWLLENEEQLKKESTNMISRHLCF